MRYSNDIVCDVLNYLEINLCRKITIEEIAFKFSYDRYYIMKLFKKEIGMSIISFINHLRIYRSIICIQNENYSITRISIMYGFYSIEYFSEIFRQIMGVSPRDYKFYYKKRYLRDDSLENVILSHWIELQLLMERVYQYKKNRRPNSIPILKRSIFY